MNIYVGNLALDLAGEELRREFTAFGLVTKVAVMNDAYIGSGQSKGYGFVEMPSESEGNAAIVALNGKSLRERIINVVQALPLTGYGGNDHHGHETKSRYKSRARQREK